MSQGELQRVKVIENAVQGRFTVAEIAGLLQLSERQVKRLKKKYRADGTAWVHHGNRGSRATNAIPDAVREQVVQVAIGKYAGFNDTHLHEKLTAAEGLKIGRQRVRRILRIAGISIAAEAEGAEVPRRFSGRDSGGNHSVPAHLFSNPGGQATNPRVWGPSPSCPG